MRLFSLLPPILLFAATTTASPAEWDPLGLARRANAPKVDERAGRPSHTQAQSVAAVQDNGDSGSSKPSEAKSTQRASQTETDTSITTPASNAPTASNKPSASNRKSPTTSKYETTKTFNDVLPPGGVSMITPAAILGQQYYKIGNENITEFVTFAWNYTSLSVTPTAVDVLASCALNDVTYTIALNQSITGPVQTVLWDTGEFDRTASISLAVATYTLIVYDSDSSPEAVARAGYLGTYNQFAFGLYTPKAPPPLQGIVCATCGAASALERHTVMFLLGLAGVTVLSFGWFTGVAGLW